MFRKILFFFKVLAAIASFIIEILFSIAALYLIAKAMQYYGLL